MSEYSIGEVTASDSYSRAAVKALLEKEGIRLDANLDYTCAMYDEDMNVIATGSLFLNTLRCMAVSSDHQGEALMNEIVTHLVQKQMERGMMHLFLYTKCDTAKFFATMGFYEIARIEGHLVFMENRRDGFSSYLKQLHSETEAQLAEKGGAFAGWTKEDTDEKTEKKREDKSDEKQDEKTKKIAAVVMNANPFTLGHRHLLETASKDHDLVHVFVVSEDASLFPFRVRKKLVMEGSRDLSNLIYHESGPYIISNATFPSYFQKSGEDVIRGHALLDLNIFGHIAEELGITERFVGEEPRSQVTGIYNEIMHEELPKLGLRCVEIPRLRNREKDEAISASDVRSALKTGDFCILEKLLPKTTLDYVKSEEAEPVLAAIRRAQEVIHY